MNRSALHFVVLVITLTAACALSAGCGSNAGSQPSSSSGPSGQATGTPPLAAKDPWSPAIEQPDLGAGLKIGMSYDELAQSMRANGWTPVEDGACMLNMVGADYVSFCAKTPQSQTCGYCKQLPGLRQCSADGACLFVFGRAADAARIEVGMGGELENWKYNAPDTVFSVSGWRHADVEK